MAAKFEYWQSTANKEWRWHLKAANGKVIADSGEGYKNKDDCLKGITSVKNAEVVEKKA